MSKEKLTQLDRIERHLRDFGGITSFESFIEYGITRLSAIIYTLRHKKGYDIRGEWVEKKNRYGEPTRFKKYQLIKKNLFDFIKGA